MLLPIFFFLRNLFLIFLAVFTKNCGKKNRVVDSPLNYILFSFLIVFSFNSLECPKVYLPFHGIPIIFERNNNQETIQIMRIDALK